MNMIDRRVFISARSTRWFNGLLQMRIGRRLDDELRFDPLFMRSIFKSALRGGGGRSAIQGKLGGESAWTRCLFRGAPLSAGQQSRSSRTSERG